MTTPLFGEKLTLAQPDGSSIEVRVWANQEQAVFETPEGDPVVLDPSTGFYQPRREPQMKETAEQTFQRAPRSLELTRGTTRWEERLEERKTRRRLAAREGLAVRDLGVVGDFVGLCLLIEFPDAPATIPREEVEAFCNQRGYRGFGNNGSVFDYFFEISGGRLRSTNIVAPYYRALHPRSHYADPSVVWPRRAKELIREALDHHRANGFDFRRFSVDDQNHVRALNVFYAGDVAGQFRTGLWPHAHELFPAFELMGGRKLRDYQITNMGNALTLGTFCHENGHLICDFPDLYDLDGGSFGTGAYCLMAFGSSPAATNPAQVCAYLKRRAGWADRIVELAPGMEVTLAAGRNEIAIFARNPTEYFLLEHRQRAGRDQGLPDAGLAIWHVDEEGSNKNQQMTPELHFECSLEQADGRFHLEREQGIGDADDLFQAGRFGADTVPSSRWWDGTPSGLEIRVLAATTGEITFRVEG